MNSFHPDDAGHSGVRRAVADDRRLPVRQQPTKIRCPTGSLVADLPCAKSAVQPPLARLAGLIRTYRTERRCQWRRLNQARRALLVLAHLRNGDSNTRVAAGFPIGTTTAWRYVQESMNLLAELADDVRAAAVRGSAGLHHLGRHAHPDRPPGRRAAVLQRQHKQHGVNVQLLADPAGWVVWASPALPGTVHDATAARTVGLIDALADVGIKTFSYRGYQGASGTIRTRFKRHRLVLGCPAASETSIAPTPASAP